MARTKTNLDNFNRALKRAEQLFESKMISPDAFDKARYDVERERATLALQQYEIEEATIRAPIDGVVTDRHIKLGNTLMPGNSAFEIKRLDAIEAVLNVPERELVRIQVGQEANVRIDALDESRFMGVVARVAPHVDPSSGTFRVTVELPNDAIRLKPGMFARVDVRYDSRKNALLVAREAVVVKGDDSNVFVVADGVATRRAVNIGYAMGNRVEVLSGLVEGEDVIVTGQSNLKDGAIVRVVQL